MIKRDPQSKAILRKPVAFRPPRRDAKHLYRRPARRQPFQEVETSQPLIDTQSTAYCVQDLGGIIQQHYYKVTELNESVIFLGLYHGGKKLADHLGEICAMQHAGGTRRPYIFFRIIDRYMDIKSYNGQTAGEPTIVGTDCTASNMKDRHILVIDDIYERGRTMMAALRRIRELCDYSEEEMKHWVRTVTLVWKPDTPDCGPGPDWYGFRTTNHFLAGYGMDLADGAGRHLNAVYIDEARPEMLSVDSWAKRWDYVEPGNPPGKPR